MRLFKRQPSIKLNVLIYKESNEWIAHCLQMDIVTTGQDEKDVEKDIINLIKAQIIFALQNNNLSNLFKPAPEEEWAKLEYATKCSNIKIKIDIDEDNQTVRRHPPINEVELCFA